MKIDVTYKNYFNNKLLVPQVLRSGELIISSLRWSDMGEFTCYATNVFGSQLAKTFVYPARVSIIFLFQYSS